MTTKKKGIGEDLSWYLYMVSVPAP